MRGVQSASSSARILGLSGAAILVVGLGIKVLGTERIWRFLSPSAPAPEPLNPSTPVDAEKRKLWEEEQKEKRRERMRMRESPEMMLKALLTRQKELLPEALQLLKKHGKKRESVDHWAWWVFPTSVCGKSELSFANDYLALEEIKSCVTVGTAARLFDPENRESTAVWRQLLELVCDLIEARFAENASRITDILPEHDHGRIYYFIEFWTVKYRDAPEWLVSVANRLKEFQWGDENWGASWPVVKEVSQAVKAWIPPLNRGISEEGESVEQEADERSIKALKQRQEQYLAKALENLNKYGVKRDVPEDHWSWWAFPTSASGKSELIYAGDRMAVVDEVKSKVTVNTAPKLFAEDHSATAKIWQELLEKICDLVEKRYNQNGLRTTDVLPEIDHGRVHYFCEFWSDKYMASPEWLISVTKRLKKFSWVDEKPEWNTTWPGAPPDTNIV
eukprot:CAMPEP_0184296426 /NCGR_PEP_ID=MMETSP1049-20130417/7396_1 /TAXON_ID=77928 /ORGANISM="Proteomonas sulcata, Strain CCMP704" /LENGTH=447 /DNA_ID=CAMNT_0026605653 /DNA_START=133 /DNA_END=1476 /DNA_ORIENTATION=-